MGVTEESLAWMMFWKSAMSDKPFGAHVVLRDIDFYRPRGRGRVASSASSGSGKSTLLRCINLLETADCAREILYHGDNDARAWSERSPEYRAKVGMVFQSVQPFQQYDRAGKLRGGPDKGAEAQPQGRGREGNAMLYLEKVGMAPLYKRAARARSRAARSSAWQLRGRWRWSRRCCCSTSRRPRSTRRWWARCCRSCASWRKDGHDDAGRDARDVVRARREQPRGVHVRRPYPRGRHARAGVQPSQG